MLRILSFLILFLIPWLVDAQEVELIGLQVQKQFIESVEPFFIMGFRVHKQEQFVGVSESSRVISIADDSGFDLLEAHRIISARNIQRLKDSGRFHPEKEKDERLIVFEESISLPPKEGFLVIIRSWALPLKQSKEIHLKAEVVYRVTHSETLEEETIEQVVLQDKSSFLWNDRVIPFQHWKYTDSVKGEMHMIRLRNDDMGVAIQKIEQLDEQGQLKQDLMVSVYPEFTEFGLSNLESSVNLRITFKRVSYKTVLIDQKFGIGL